MSALQHNSFFISPEDYLTGEENSETKHEYLNGVVYGMTGGTSRHTDISINITSALKTLLRGKPCLPKNSDLKVHLRNGDDNRYYYPDVTVVCGPVDPKCTIVDKPTVIFEVLSPATERFDSGEKRDAYLRCESLQAYVIVHTERIEVTIYARTPGGWVATRYNELSDTLPLPMIDTALPLAEIYEE